MRPRRYGIRANVILPGLMNTPMAVDTRAREWNKTRAEVEADRDRQVPLRRKMGTGWDVANAALFLASDEANFITGVTLPVDGGAGLGSPVFPRVDHHNSRPFDGFHRAVLPKVLQDTEAR